MTTTQSPSRIRLLHTSQLTPQEISNNQYGATCDTFETSIAKLLLSGRLGQPSLTVKKQPFWVYRDRDSICSFKLAVNCQSRLVDVFIHRDLVETWTDDNRATTSDPAYSRFLKYVTMLTSSRVS